MLVKIHERQVNLQKRVSEIMHFVLNLDKAYLLAFCDKNSEFLNKVTELYEKIEKFNIEITSVLLPKVEACERSLEEIEKEFYYLGKQKESLTIEEISVSDFRPQKAGGPPPQRGVPANLSGPEMLLFAAWANGLEVGDTVHRFYIFGFIQSHVKNRAEEPMQREIENSPFWDRAGAGHYKLNLLGFNILRQRFGQPLSKQSFSSKFLFSREINEKTFTTISDPENRSISTLVNGKRYPPPRTWEILEGQGIKYNIDSNSNPLRVMNWIVQDNCYKWERIE